MAYQDFINAFDKQIEKVAHINGAKEIAERLKIENKLGGLSAINANYAMKQIISMSEEELVDLFTNE